MMAKDLPPRENTLFKRILKCYENKQYKSGLKHARQILSNSKYQEHGETLAMMGLTLNCLGRKEEAYDNVKRGLRNNLQSHVCWHVFGLLQRSDKKYEEAIKCYRNALRWDKDNLQILRDLSLLQIQTRDLDGYKMTRHQLLMLRANQRAGWIGYAIALHILGEFENALNVLLTFRKTQEGKPADYEYSELLLYEASIMVEAGRFKDALSHIYIHRESILDIQSWLEMAGDLHVRAGEHEESARVYEQLYHRNPENTEYIEKYITARQPYNDEESLEICRKLKVHHPRSEATFNFSLKLSSGNTFRSLVDEYLQRQLRKGVPPLFNILKHLLQDKTKLIFIKDLLHGYLTSLEQHKKFTSENDDTEFPTSYLHVLIFLAQLYDYERDTQRALHYIDRAIQHTPTYIDPYMVKSKVYKHAGDLPEASRWMDEARTLDLADRYLNSKCAKYMLRAGLFERAEETCALFTREGQPAVENLNEMQCMWFLTESARTYFNSQDWASTLQKCHEVEKHFVDIVEDQFDFHPYSMRKMTLRAYMGLLKLEDEIRGHVFFNKVADIAVKTYLYLHDKPLTATNGLGNGEADEMTEKEKKKLESKKKRAAKKKQQLKQEAAVNNSNNAVGGKDKKQAADGEFVPPPIVGEDLVKTETPLDDALKFLNPLRTLSPNSASTHRLAFEVFSRKGKLLLMIQSLKRSIKTCPSSPEIPLHLTQLVQFVKENGVPSGTVGEIATSEMKELLPGGNIQQWLSAREKSTSSGDLKSFFMLRCAQATLCPESSRDQLEQVLCYHLTDTFPPPCCSTETPPSSCHDTPSCNDTPTKKSHSTVDLESCYYVYDYLKYGVLNPSTEDVAAFSAKCHAAFPLAAAFHQQEADVPR